MILFLHGATSPSMQETLAQQSRSSIGVRGDDFIFLGVEETRDLTSVSICFQDLKMLNSTGFSLFNCEMNLPIYRLSFQIWGSVGLIK